MPTSGGGPRLRGPAGIWSLFKRFIIGAFHKMSEKHTDRYLDELEGRYNNRHNPHIFRDTLERIVRAPRP